MQRNLAATVGAVALLAVPTAASADSVIVKYKSGAAAKSKTAAADRAGLSKVLGAVEATGAQVVEVADAKAAAAVLNRSSTVEYAEPNLELKAFGVPNDARFGELYGLNNSNDADMDAPEGWDLAGYPNIPATTVGIVDTGIDKSARGPGGQDRRLRLRAAADEPRARRHLQRRQRPRHARRGHDRGQGQQRRRRRGRLLQLQPRDLQGAERGRLRHHRRRRELHHLPRGQGREGHLHVAGRRVVDHAADRGAQRHSAAGR